MPLLNLAYFKSKFLSAIMDTVFDDQHRFGQVNDLRQRNQQLVRENAQLRRDLKQAQQTIQKLKYLLRRTI